MGTPVAVQTIAAFWPSFNVLTGCSTQDVNPDQHNNYLMLLNACITLSRAIFKSTMGCG
jgi:hypothetical protein